jgi:hypothetical protein
MHKDMSKKIKSQKNAALFLIFVPMIILISYIGKSDFDTYGVNNYVICGALLILMFCGGVSLNNSLRKQRELKD